MDINVVFNSERSNFVQGQAQFRRLEELYSPWLPARARAMDGPSSNQEFVRGRA